MPRYPTSLLVSLLTRPSPTSVLARPFSRIVVSSSLSLIIKLVLCAFKEFAQGISRHGLLRIDVHTVYQCQVPLNKQIEINVKIIVKSS